MHRDPRRGRGHPLCRRPQHPGGGGGCLSPAGLHAPPGGGGGPRIRVPPPVGAGRPGGRAAEGRLRPRRGPAAVHRAPGRVHGQHPDPQAGDVLLPGRAGPAAVCGGLHPPQPGGGARPVQRPGRHRGHLSPGYARPGPPRVLGRGDRLHLLLRPDEPAAGRLPEQDLPFPRPGGAVRQLRGDCRGPARRRPKGPGQAPRRPGAGHGPRSGPAGRRPDARGHGQILRHPLPPARHPAGPPGRAPAHPG